MQLRSGKTYTSYSQTEMDFVYRVKKIITEFNKPCQNTKLHKIKYAVALFEYFIENKEVLKNPKMFKLKQSFYTKYSQLCDQTHNTVYKAYYQILHSHKYMTRRNVKLKGNYNIMAFYAERLYRLDEQLWRIATDCL